MPAVELLDADAPDAQRRSRSGARAAAHPRAHARGSAASSTTACCPAEAGLEERAISFTKGCYPGQEPVARLHYRGHPNRGLRVLGVEGAELPAYDAELALDGKAVGRVTSAAPDPAHGVVALAYVRREVPADDAELAAGRPPARD